MILCITSTFEKIIDAFLNLHDGKDELEVSNFASYNSNPLLVCYKLLSICILNKKSFLRKDESKHADRKFEKKLEFYASKCYYFNFVLPLRKPLVDIFAIATHSSLNEH